MNPSPKIDDGFTPLSRQMKPKWNAPIKGQRTRSLHWARHVYDMIRVSNPAFLLRADICEAYNELVACLMAYGTELVTRIPWTHHIYRAGIKYDSPLDKKELRSFFHIHREATGSFEQQVDHVLGVYEPLYNLIKDNVVPYMEQAFEKYHRERDTKLYTRLLASYVAKHERLTEKYEREIALVNKQMQQCRLKLEGAELRV